MTCLQKDRICHRGIMSSKYLLSGPCRVYFSSCTYLHCDVNWRGKKGLEFSERCWDYIICLPYYVWSILNWSFMEWNVPFSRFNRLLSVHFTLVVIHVLTLQTVVIRSSWDLCHRSHYRCVCVCCDFSAYIAKMIMLCSRISLLSIEDMGPNLGQWKLNEAKKIVVM